MPQAKLKGDDAKLPGAQKRQAKLKGDDEKLSAVDDTTSFYTFVNGLDFAGGQVQQVTMNCRVQSLSSVRSAWLKLVL